MYGIIYKATFPNGKVYIGQTTRTLEQRKSEHYKASKNKKNAGYKYPFYCAIRKYGWNELKWELIDTGENKKELDEKEIYWIEYYHCYIGFSNSNGYNLTLGGASVRNFTVLNEKELYNCGLEIKQGMSKRYIKEKYKINDAVYLRISKGVAWFHYTKIAPFDYYIDEKNSTITRYQVDRILKLFKEHGNSRIVSEIMDIGQGIVLNVVKGRSWSKYTGILDDSTFYAKYEKTSSIFKNDIPIILQLKNEGYSYTEIAEKMEIEEFNIRDILSGRTLSKFTKIKRKTKQELLKNGEMPNTKISKTDVDKIIKLNKNGKRPYEISKELNIPNYIITSILNGKSWKEYTGIKYVSKEEKIKDNPLFSKLKKEDVLKIVEKSKQGMTQVEIAKEFNVTKETVHSILTGRTWGKYTGIKKREKTTNNDGGYKISHKDIDNILNLHKMGTKQKEISNKLNISLNIVNDIITGKRWSSYTGIQYNPKKRKKKDKENK